MPNENLSKRVNEIVEKADDLLSRIDKMTDESIEAEFRKIWKMIRELIFDINYKASDIDDLIKREHVEKIAKKSLELSQKVLERITDERFREYIIHVFIDWLIFEAIHRWDIELPKIEIPEPPVTKTESLKSSYESTELSFRAEPYSSLYISPLQRLLKELIAKTGVFSTPYKEDQPVILLPVFAKKLEPIKPSVEVVIEPPAKFIPISYQRPEKEYVTPYKIKEKTKSFYSSFGGVINT